MADSDYPTDLLCNVRPLIFAVDSIIDTDPTELAKAGGVTTSNSRGTSDHFETFLEALVGPEVSDSDSDADEGTMSVAASTSAPTADHPPPPPPPPPPGTSGKFLSSTTKKFKKTKKRSKDKQGSIKERLAKKLHLPSSFSSSLSSPGKHGKFSSLSSSNLHVTVPVGNDNSADTFLQRSNLLPVSSRHAFPPSRDPDGVTTHQRIKNGYDGVHGPDGILPTGWLEKHLHALPSVLLVVTTVDGSGELDKTTGPASMRQDRQDDHVYETVEALRMSLASKRNCGIHLVCLVVGGAGAGGGAVSERVATLSERCNLDADGDVTVIREADLAYLDEDEDSSTNVDPLSIEAIPESLSTLRKTIQLASLRYYTAQSQRARDKLAAIPHTSGGSVLSQGGSLFRTSRHVRLCRIPRRGLLVCRGAVRSGLSEVAR